MRPDRPTFVIKLRPAPGVDAVRALRALLKAMRRRYGLHVVEIRHCTVTEGEEAHER